MKSARSHTLSPIAPATFLAAALTLAALAGCAVDDVTSPVPALPSVTVIPEATALALGDVVLVEVHVVNGGGASPTLSTDDPAVAVVDPSGRLRAVGPGETLLRAAVSGATATVAVQVAAHAAQLRLQGYDGAALPVLLHADSVWWNGAPEYHEVYVVGGQLALTSVPLPRYEMTIRYQEVAVRVDGGDTTRVLRAAWSEYDRGVVGYDDQGDLAMTSEYVAPLNHRARPAPGGFAVDFRVPGTDDRLHLFYRR